jgi:predicted DNA-binding transcriptional regulator YafY
MRRTDRLYALIARLRDGRFHTAATLAGAHGVSERTIWRDMEVLRASGVPVKGERGVGYRMTAPVTLPPLNLTLTELEALHLGLAAVAEGGDEELRAAARALSARVDAVLPEDRAAAPAGWGFAVYPFADAAAGFIHMPRIRAAMRARQKLAVWTREGPDEGRRVIRPLKLDYWGRVWTVTCWCERRGDFATLRVDLVERLEVLPALFVEERGKTLMDLRAREAG